MDKIFNKKMQVVYFYLLLFICCFAISIKGAVIDPDLWSRLVMGHNVFLYGEVLKNDFLSYSPTHIWIDHEWISSTIFYAILNWFGSFGLAFLKAFLFFLSVVCVDLVVVQNQKTFFYKYKLLYIFIFLLLLMHVLIAKSLRCQNFTFIFYPILILILERYRLNEQSRLIYFTPLLILLWLNMHGGVIFGIGIILLYLIASVIQKKHCKKLLIILPISLLMFFINPWGADFIPFMFKAVTMKREYIAEWLSPFSMEPNLIFIYLLNLLAISFVFLYSLIMHPVSFNKFNLAKLFVLCTSLFFALCHIKHNYLFFITCFSLLYEEFKLLCDDIVDLLKNVFNKTISLKIPLIAAYCILAIVIFVKCPLNSYFENSKSTLPINPLIFIHDNKIEGKIFAPYYLSSFIAYKEYPHLKIYMDGRQEQVYDDELYNKQINFLYYKTDDAHKFFEKDIPDIILIEKHWPAYKFMEWQEFYKKAYEDSTYAMYFHPNIVKESYIEDQKTAYYSEKEIFKSNFFD